MKDIMNLSLRELQEFLIEFRHPRYHAKQIFSWIYKKGIRDFALMSDLSKSLRKGLRENFYFSKFVLEEKQASLDGTLKFLFRLVDGNLIESVIIPQNRRNTFCISSQVGCKFRCQFCASGMHGFKRNLKASEILNQVLFLKKYERPNNIVFMGIGEPFDNYNNVIKAIRTINAKEALNIGARKITISTCGIIPKIERLIQEGLQIELSISLHATDNKTRNKLVPINKTYPIDKLIKVCQEYYKKTRRQITLEYVMINNLNTRGIDANNLARLTSGFDAKINLIPYNEIGGLGILPPGKLEVLFFKQALLDRGLKVIVRRPRGKDIQAACGQLSSKFT